MTAWEVIEAVHDVLDEAERYQEHVRAVRIPWEWAATMLDGIRWIGADRFVCMTERGLIELVPDGRLASTAIAVPAEAEAAP